MTGKQDKSHSDSKDKASRGRLLKKKSLPAAAPATMPAAPDLDEVWGLGNPECEKVRGSTFEK